MFETLFTFRPAVQMHRAAPLAQEREEFLLYLNQRGVCPTSLRSFAALLNQIVRFLRLMKLRDVRGEWASGRADPDTRARPGLQQTDIR